MKLVPMLMLLAPLIASAQHTTDVADTNAGLRLGESVSSSNSASTQSAPAMRVQDTWSRYCNSRFGMCIDYPAGMKAVDPSANGDGVIIQDQRGFKLILSAIHNTSPDTLQSELRNTKTEFPKPTYERAGTNWFVLSGYRGANIYYIKTFVTVDHITHLRIEYPTSSRDTYDKVTSRISSSFTPARPYP